MANEADFPDKLQMLFAPKRYKVLYGGRGGAKSWGVARALLLMGLERPLRVLCAREYQNSIKDSVHKLLGDQVWALGLQNDYDVQQAIVKGNNGTEFNFEGIKQNVGKIKSYEGIDICWVEEAQNVSKTSWDVLIPTIRKEGSEIWITFNPELEEDETYQRFVVHPPTNSVVEKLTWKDNPFFPDVLRQEMLDLKGRDYDAYLNVWEGFCRAMLDGAIYASELREAQELNRIMSVPYDHTKAVFTFWDLGYSDMTSIWFAQIVGYEYHLIDYMQDKQHNVDFYLKALQRKGYVYETHWLPHDAKAKQLGTGRSIEEQMREKGFPVRIVPKLSVADGINAARTVFPQCYFDKEKCSDGLYALRHYRYDANPDSKTLSRVPLHDWSSHGADAFRYLAVALRQPKMKGSRVLDELLGKGKRIIDLLDVGGSSGSHGWMG